MIPWLTISALSLGLFGGAAVGEDLLSQVTTKPDSVAAVEPVEASSGHDWSGFLGPTGDGKSRENILLKWPEEGLKVLWFKPVGEGYSAPSVADGRLFVFERVDDEARLSAWNSSTGQEIWRQGYPTAYEDLYQYSGGPRASPVIDGDRVYTYGVEGRLRAHSASTGKVLWDVDTAARFGVVQNFFGVGATPIIERDLLIAPVGGSPSDSPSISSGDVRGNGSGIVAFDKRTGEVRYQLSNELASYSSPRIGTVAGRRRGFSWTRGGLLAFDPAKGTADFFFPWRAKKLESVNASTPVLVENTVFVSESYGPGSVLLRVLPQGYEVVWQDPPGRGQALATHWSTPIYHDGYLYGSSGQSRRNAELRAIEHATGKVMWTKPGLGRSTLLYAQGHLVVLTETGRLLLVEATPKRFHLLAEMDLGALTAADNAAAKTGAAKTSAEAMHQTGPVLRFPAWNAPILSHGRLYLRGKDQIICLDLAPRRATAPVSKHPTGSQGSSSS